MKRNLLNKSFLVGFLTWSSFHAVHAGSPILLDTFLTDEYTNGSPGAAKYIFAPTTSDIYTVWQSNQVSTGQKIKYVCIADDTHNVAPANTTVDEVVVEVPKANNPSQNYFSGKFTQHKPTKGWPVGSYHVDLYVDGVLSKTVKFTIADKVPSSLPKQPSQAAEQSEDIGWEAISVDSTNHTKDTAFGIGSGETKQEAEKYAQQFCVQSGGGSHCNVVMTFQQCGAFAISKNNQGMGTGITKKQAEEQALSACKDSDCAVVTSDCSSSDE